MHLLRRYAALLTVAAAFSLSLASCSNSKVDECNKLLQIANKYNDAAKTTGNNNKPLDSKTMLKQAEEADQKAKEMEAVAVKDEKLKQLKSRFVSLFKDESKALRDAVKAATTADKVAKKNDFSSVNASLKATDMYLKATEVYTKQTKLINEVSTYCTK